MNAGVHGVMNAGDHVVNAGVNVVNAGVHVVNAGFPCDQHSFIW